MATDISFTLGICSTDETCNLEKLISVTDSEMMPQGISITDVVIAVSGGSSDTAAIAMNSAMRFQRTVIIEENRSGKANAINSIISNMRGNNLLLINGDALPEAGSIASLMEDLVISGSAMMCAQPVPAASDCNPVAGSLVKFLWALHNSTMETLEKCGERMHLTDEMMAISRKHIMRLPDGTVNDGALMSTRTQVNGGAVSFSRRSFVRVSVPVRMRDIISQRRRIMFGHLQVKELIGVLPGTAEFTAWKRPLAGLRILLDFSRKHPLESLILPVAAIVEMFSLLGALLDRKKRSDAHAVWKRVSSAAWR
ncbi:MAG: glycosyltransferase family 2 protein [Thermoplasmata archaeon]|nr:glycosyltransferase family 2 protein [Candidatus Sysuiplasma acidicola]MBX8645233.1 glycosyltransferase family 2 protein [Candidatus Sysuiplasma acidicola]MDH2904776.1 glycosyltransferase family A protein [Methanomassiliicoccales archaeon]